MDKETFTKIRFAVDEGKNITVRHTVTHQTGKVLGCAGDSFEVEPQGGRDLTYWPREECERT